MRAVEVTWKIVLQNLRSKLRNRRALIAACSHQEFLSYSRQFFAFVEATPALKALIIELLARNSECEKREFAAMHAQTAFASGPTSLGDTAGEAATIACVRWRAFAGQDSPHAFFMDAAGGVQGSLNTYRRWYVEPLFDYLDEALEDGNVILATLVRYKRKVEWYRRAEVLDLYQSDTARGEALLKRHMSEFLFDEGLDFHVEPASASGEPDVVSLENSGQPFIGDAKIFNGANAGHVKKGFHQVHRYCSDYSEATGYLIVFDVSEKQLRVNLPSSDGIPRLEYNHKTIFLVSIDICEHVGTASTRGSMRVPLPLVRVPDIAGSEPVVALAPCCLRIRLVVDIHVEVVAKRESEAICEDVAIVSYKAGEHRLARPT